MAERAGDPAVAVVIPVRDEAGNIGPLLAEVAEAFRGIACEVLVVDDASADGSAAEAGGADADAQILRHLRRAGQSAAMLTGARHARAPWIVTLDGDGQNDPRDAARIVRAVLDGTIDADLVVGKRTVRHDGWLKALCSRVANGLRRWMFGDPLSDAGCGLKVVRRDVLLELPAFSTMHRFLGMLVARAGRRVAEAEVAARPRKTGRSKYGILDRLPVTVVDLLGLLWLRRRSIAVALADTTPRPPERNP